MKNWIRLGVALLCWIVASWVAALTVPVTYPAFVVNPSGSFSTGAIVYFGPWVLQKEDFGYFYLNTTTLQTGVVQVIGYPNSQRPPSNSGVYVVGDCNGASTFLGANGWVYGWVNSCRLSPPLPPATSDTVVFSLPTTYLKGTPVVRARFGLPSGVMASSQVADPGGFRWSFQVVVPLHSFLWVRDEPPTPTPGPPTLTPTPTKTQAGGTPTPTPQFICVTVTPK